MDINSKNFDLEDVINYLKNPYYTNPGRFSFFSNVKYVLLSYLMCSMGIIAAGLIILSIDYTIVEYFGIDSIYKQIKATNTNVKTAFGNYSFVVVVFIVPLLEELIFRLPLNTKNSSIALAGSLLLFRFLNGGLLVADFSQIVYWANIFVSVSFFLFTRKFLSKKLVFAIKNSNFKTWYYFITISFGLVHILNIKRMDLRLMLLYPLYVMPQIVMSIFLGNIRMQRGFIWGVVLHGLINSVSFLF